MAPLSRDQILDAALTLAEERGLAAVSMRGVAARLGVTPMALYRHVGDKQGLLDGLVERLLDELPMPDPTLGWRNSLRALAEGTRELARRHPDAFLLLLRRPAVTPLSLARRESVYEALREAGVAEAEIPRVERLLSTFMFGFAASEAGGRFAAHDAETLEADLRALEALLPKR